MGCAIGSWSVSKLLNAATRDRRQISRQRLRSQQCGDGFTNHVYTRCIEYDRMQTASGSQVLLAELVWVLHGRLLQPQPLGCQVSMAVLFISMLTQLLLE